MGDSPVKMVKSTFSSHPRLDLFSTKRSSQLSLLGPKLPEDSTRKSRSRTSKRREQEELPESKRLFGMSLDEIRRRRTEDAATRDKALEASKKEIRERNVKKMQAKKTTTGGKKNQAATTKAPAAKAAAAPKGGKGGKGKR